jgi:hypothetical protein
MKLLDRSKKSFLITNDARKETVEMMAAARIIAA